ncbi:MAG: hypothetical protein ACRDWD_09880 [Acidimicrobiia bacterium]
MPRVRRRAHMRAGGSAHARLPIRELRAWWRAQGDGEADRRGAGSLLLPRAGGGIGLERGGHVGCVGLGFPMGRLRLG